jgi:hypothetical protein
VSANPFEYQPPDQETIDRLVLVRASFKHLYAVIVEEVPESAERTLAVRKLEEANMWANKALAFKGQPYL